MDKCSVTMSIRCPQCLAWSMDDANFCHRCGFNLRPPPEMESLRQTWQATCAHCLRQLNRRMMKQTKAGKWLCFDHIACQDIREGHGIIESLMEIGFDRDVAEAWMEMPVQAFDGLTPRQMIQDGRRGSVEALIAKTRTALAP